MLGININTFLVYVFSVYVINVLNAIKLLIYGCNKNVVLLIELKKNNP